MKIRNGFVSNSSSSSFVLYKHKIPHWLNLSLESGKFIDIASNAKTIEYPEEAQGWLVTDNNGKWDFSTCMDNFSMIEFITKELGIDSTLIEDIDY